MADDVKKITRNFFPDLCRWGNQDSVPRKFSCYTPAYGDGMVHDARCIELREAVAVIVERVERQRDEALGRLARAGRLAATALSSVAVETGRLTDMDFDFTTLQDALRGVQELARAPVVGPDTTLAVAVALMRQEITDTLCISVPIAKVGRKGGITSPVAMCPPGDPCWWCEVRAFIDRYDGKAAS